MDFPEQELTQIVESVWSSTLSTEATPGVESRRPCRKDDFACCVQIHGGWQGAVTLHCSRDLAVQLTSIMFSLDDASVDPDLVCDALGEIANMIAGNLKQFTPGEDHHVSMPAVAEGEISQLSVRGTQQLGELFFESLGSPFSVAVLERAEA